LFAAHADDVIAGFSALYSFLLAKREALSAPEGPLAWFRDALVRVVIKPSADYLAIEELAQGSRNALDDGVDWSLRFEALGSAIPASRDVEAAWRIFAAERHALSRLDVPFFSAASNATELVSCGGETIPNCLVDTPFARATARVAALSSDDLQRQVRLISAALPARLDRSVRRVSRTKPGKDLAADAVTAARRIARTIARSAVRAGDGASWVGPVPLDHDHASLDVVETDLYAGTIGIALFLAALSRSVTDAQSRALALAAIASAERQFAAPRGSARSVPRMNIGGGTGIGSAIYGLVRIAELLEELRLLDLAAFLSSAITPERVAADRRFCIMRGAAGAILGLLALHAATKDATVLERAASCGRHLVANAGRSALPDGLLEGKAGLALALTRLHAATGDPAFRSAAWRFWRPDAAMSCGWCSGASGIGFAAMACRESDDDVMPIIESGLAAALASPPLATDCICCGNFGRIDFLLTAGQRLGRYHLIERARAETEALLGAALETGGFRLERRCDDLQPGLFRGLSGIGLTLLRVADRGKLPAVTIWE
jgi:type 2 lantibiotic biosynthesis protein LanM